MSSPGKDGLKKRGQKRPNQRSVSETRSWTRSVSYKRAIQGSKSYESTLDEASGSQSPDEKKAARPETTSDLRSGTSFVSKISGSLRRSITISPSKLNFFSRRGSKSNSPPLDSERILIPADPDSEELAAKAPKPQKFRRSKPTLPMKAKDAKRCASKTVRYGETSDTESDDVASLNTENSSISESSSITTKLEQQHIDSEKSESSRKQSRRTKDSTRLPQRTTRSTKKAKPK